MCVIIAIAIFSLAMPLGANRATPREYVLDLSPATQYTVASHATGCPEWVLQGLHYAESSCGTNLNHPDPNDVGEYGLNQRFQEERDRKFGRLDPREPVQAGILAGLIIMDNLAQLGDIDLAIAAYKQGPTGVREDGPLAWYVERVISGGGR